MLTIDECLGFCELDAPLVEALARHEHVPVMVAVSLAATLLQSPRGIYRLHTVLLEEIESAWASSDRQAAKLLDKAYSGFRSQHPMPRVIS